MHHDYVLPTLKVKLTTNKTEVNKKKKKTTPYRDKTAQHINIFLSRKYKKQFNDIIE